MSGWIKKKSAQLQADREGREQRNNALPSKASAAWRGLVGQVERDVEEMKSDNEMRRIIGSSFEFNALDSSFTVKKRTYPVLYLAVEFSYSANTITAVWTRRRTEGAQDIEDPPSRVFTLDLDSQENIYAVDEQSGKRVEIAHLPQVWLEPFTE